MMKDVWVAGILREDPMSVLVRVTLINHILSAGCVGDFGLQHWTRQAWRSKDRGLCAKAHFILCLSETGGVGGGAEAGAELEIKNYT